MNSSLVQSYKFKAMGGEFEAMCFPQQSLSEADVQELFRLGENEVLRIENKFTDFKDSEFNQINSSAGEMPVKVDDEILNLVLRSVEISKKSGGLFDITFATIGHHWRNSQGKGETLSLTKREELRQVMGYEKVVVDKSESTIFLPHKDLRIGLGGIGKGYAVDQMYKLLRDQGLYNFYINGAGDIRVHSRADAPRKWRVGIQNPFSPEKSVGVVQVSNEAVATSGGYVHYNRIKGMEDNHVINPFSGQSTGQIISATVLGAECVECDTTGTILLNMGEKEAIDYLNTNELIGLIINIKGKSFLSKKAIEHFGV